MVYNVLIKQTNMVFKKGGTDISMTERKTKEMLDYAKQLAWLDMLLKVEQIDTDEYLKIKKALKTKFKVANA